MPDFREEAYRRYASKREAEAFIAGCIHGQQTPEYRPRTSLIQTGALEIDLDAETVRKHGRVIRLTSRERSLFFFLAHEIGRVVDRAAISAWVWGPGEADTDQYRLRVYVQYLRRKIEDDPASPRYIQTDWGRGYGLARLPEAA